MQCSYNCWCQMSFSSSNEVIIYSFSLYWVFVNRSSVFFFFSTESDIFVNVKMLSFFYSFLVSEKKNYRKILIANFTEKPSCSINTVKWKSSCHVWGLFLGLINPHSLLQSEKIIIHWFLSHLPLSNVNRGAVDLDGRIEPGDMLLQVCAAFPYLLYIHF